MIQNIVRVLLVEDDEDDMVLTTRLLGEIEIARFDVRWITDYAEALEHMCSDQFDVCLADYRLGLHNGVDLVRDATRRGCRIPVILLTGQGDHEVDLAAMNAGAADFLSKAQITSAVLERSIRYAIQHRKAEEQRIRLLREQSARAEAEAANRSKDQFLAVLSHELRTPLTAVLMSVSALDQEQSIPARSRDLLQIIKRNVELEARLIDDLLDLTRIARGKLEIRKEIVDLHEQLRDVINMCCGTEVAAKNLRVEVEPTAERHHVWGDGARLQQVLWNLVRNAIKFTPEGGRITIRTSNRGEEGSGFGVQGSGEPSSGAQRDTGVSPVQGARNVGEPGSTEATNNQHGRDAHVTMEGAQHVGSASGDGPSAPSSDSASAKADPTQSSLNPEPRTLNPPAILVEVSDTGIGILPESLPKVFNAFEQTDRNITRQFGGLGLGLAICRALVELHGGTIRATSAGRNQGATFTVELPLATVAHPSSAAGNGMPGDSRTPDAARGVSVLLVEDHPDTASAMTRILNRRGYHVRAAGTMAEALRAAASNRFDVVVSDIGLPDGSGLELMRQLLAKHHLKGIALSGFGMEEDVTRSREAGFAEHLTKPIDLRQLEAAIARVTSQGEHAENSLEAAATPTPTR